MRFLVALLALFSIFTVFTQEKVTWSAVFDDKQQEIVITANIEKGWHMYSQNIDPMAGPVPTEFMFSKNTGFELMGRVIEPKPLESYDENFEATLQYFEHQVVFKQKINAKSKTSTQCTITFMVCNEVMCLPPVDVIIPIDINPIRQ
jgi:thiol:disulfide interchange protein